ncbi:hypothetical protein CEXT_91501 [Caerostris extrusa]|uniref:Uncharacterized protein n=1 Tax=Caerostris extrusa TaxID=172846 RepID=A0AAV4XC17_CAEEX|nr:hypothetical protein CEXT_91501 [Caerostris extrusa]
MAIQNLKPLTALFCYQFKKKKRGGRDRGVQTSEPETNFSENLSRNETASQPSLPKCPNHSRFRERITAGGREIKRDLPDRPVCLGIRILIGISDRPFRYACGPLICFRATSPILKVHSKAWGGGGWKNKPFRRP